MCLARQCGLYDVLAKGLSDLGYAYYYCGHYAEAIRAYEEFLAHESRYSDDLRAKTPHVRYNLGTALSAAGRNSEALACFKAAWEALRAGPDVKMAWTARSHLIREYLEADELAPAKALLQVGEAYLQAHPDDTEARIQHLVESAEYHYRRGDLRAAYATAAQGMPLVTTDSAQRSQLNLIAARVALAEGRHRVVLTHHGKRQQSTNEALVPGPRPLAHRSGIRPGFSRPLRW